MKKYKIIKLKSFVNNTGKLVPLDFDNQRFKLRLKEYSIFLEKKIA
jgi:hypothetical protein